MRRTNPGTKNITLSLRVPKEEAIKIIGRLWAKGIISDKQYIRRLDELDKNESKQFAERRLALSNMLNGGKNGKSTKIGTQGL